MWLNNILSKNAGEKFEIKLLKKYGKCREYTSYGLKILFFTDTHNCLAHSEDDINYLKALKSTDYDLCLVLGDISGDDFTVIKELIPLKKNIWDSR